MEGCALIYLGLSSQVRARLIHHVVSLDGFDHRAPVKANRGLDASG
jgi:hypothetical protein